MAVAITRTADPLSTNGVISGNTITYSGISIGAAATDRFVAVMVGWEFNGGVPTCTINGIEMHRPSGAQLTTTIGAATFYKHFPAGTTAEFVVTWAAAPSAQAQHITIYSVTGAEFPAIGSAVTDTDADPISSGALNIAANGGCLAVCSDATAATARTWTGVTEDVDSDVGLFRFSTGFSTTSGTPTITVSGGNNEDGALAWIIFEPAPPLNTTAQKSFPTWPTPPHYQIDLRSWFSSGPWVIVPAGLIPRNKFDWPVPVGPAYPPDLRFWRGALSDSILSNSAYIPSRVVDWGMWEATQRLPQTWLRGALESEAQPAKPVSQPDWPLPTSVNYPPQLRTWSVAPQVTVVTQFIPSRVTEWGVPDRVSFIPWEHLPNTALLTTPPPAKPVSANDWLIPTAAVYASQLRTWLAAPQPAEAIAVAMPVRNVLDLPTRDNRKSLTWAAPFATIARDATRYIPGRVTDWGTPDRVPFQQAGIQQSANLLSVAPPAKPPTTFDWPLPQRSAYPNSLRTWINEGPRFQYVFRAPFYARRWERPYFSYEIPQSNVALLSTPQPAKPINKSDWPLPLREPERARTWLQTPMFAAPVSAEFIPCRVVDWGQSAAALRYDTWFAQSNLALLATSPSELPRNQYNWPLPLRATPSPPTWIKTPNFAVQDAPRNQHSWPLPQRLYHPPSLLTWTKSPQITVTLAKPISQQDWPLTKAAGRPSSLNTWTQFPTPRITTGLKPINQADWPLPAQRPIVTSAVIQNNLALLATQVSKPVNQFDWPLPPAQARQAITWTQGPTPRIATGLKPFNQYHWPLPRAALRITGGYSYIFTPYTGIIPPPNKPFNQFDWPYPLSAPRLADGYGYIFTPSTGIMVPPIPPPPPPRSPTTKGPLWTAQPERQNMADTGRHNTSDDVRGVTTMPRRYKDRS